MADSSQELMVRIRGDSSGVEQAAGRATKSIDGVNVSTQKATSAMRQFTNDLRNARDASDLAGAAASALAKILAGSLAGTAVLLAGKVLVDTFNQVKKTVDESKASIEKAMRDINSAGKTLNFSEAQAAANALYAEIEKVEQKTKEIEASRLQNFVASIIGAKEEMAKLATEAKRVADEILRQGIQSEAATLVINSGLSQTDKAAQQVAESYNKLIEAARKLGDQQLLNSLIITQQAEVQRVYDKERAEAQAKLNEQQQKDLQNKAKIEEEVAKKQAKLELEIIEAEIKGREKAEQIEKTIDEEKQKRHLAELQRSAERINAIEAEIQKLQEANASLNQQQTQIRGGEAQAGIGRIGGLGAGRQRPTSSEVGLQRQLELGELQGQRERKARALEDAKRQLEAQGLPSDRIAQERFLKQQAREQARTEARGTATERLQKNNEQIDSNTKLLEELNKQHQQSLEARKQLNEIEQQTTENYFDINKNAENLVEQFLEAGGAADSVSDSLEKLDEQIGEMTGGADGGAEGAKAGGGLATENTLSKVLDELTNTLNELKTYAHAT